MKVLVISGIWPPDVGGPASHAPAVAEFLRSRGHSVEVVVTADGPPAPEPYPVRWTSRRLPVGVRHAHATVLAALRARSADVVYTTGMFARSAAAATLARRPYVVKLTGDPAFERLRARGAVAGDVDAFQGGGGGAAGVPLRRLRDVVLRRAAHVFCPSGYLRELAIGWGVPADRVSVLPNPAPAPPEGSQDELRRSFGLNGPTLGFAGRLTAQKALPVLLEALRATDGVSLVVAGDGPERDAFEAGVRELGLEQRVRMLGAQPRARVVELFGAVDATVLSSSWENFPHTVVESLAAGAPVLSTDVGGVAEVVRDGENGLLVPPGRPDLLAGAIGRYFGDDELRGRLRAAAAPSVADYAPERVFAELERVLQRAAG
ncbi:MAG: glycosyltransferase family 4 protein [Gaiellaceae bacterium]